MGGSKYLAWWQMSDGNYDMMRVCDSMVRLVTHSSMLKNDNLCLKVMPLSACLCYQYDQADPDDVRHPVLQCPIWQIARSAMFRGIANMHDGCDQATLGAQGDMYIFS